MKRILLCCGIAALPLIASAGNNERASVAQAIESAVQADQRNQDQWLHNCQADGSSVTPPLHATAVLEPGANGTVVQSPGSPSACGDPRLSQIQPRRTIDPHSGRILRD